MLRVIDFANVVGYQNFTLDKGTSFFIPTFKGVAHTMTLGEIQCTQTNGVAWKTSGKPATKCNGDISLQKTDSDGNFLTTYKYFSVTDTVPTPGWYYDDKGAWVDASGITFGSGEGMIVKNVHSEGANFIVSGEVDLEPGLILPKGTSFCGNFTPVDMTLGDFQCCQTNGVAWKTSGKPATKCNGDVSLQKTDSDGNFGTTYKYFSVTDTVPTPGWYYDDKGSWVDASNIIFKSGEGFIAKNVHSEGAMLILKKPIADKVED